MADALAIVGLTSSILTFIEFGLTLASAARSIYRTVDGKVPEIQELERDLNEIERRNQEVLKRKINGALSKEERQIMSTVKECDEISSDLRRLIGKLAKRPATKSTVLESGRIAMQSVKTRNELENPEQRLRHQDQKIKESLSRKLSLWLLASVQSPIRLCTRMKIAPFGHCS